MMKGGLTEIEKLQAELRLLESNDEWQRTCIDALSGIVRIKVDRIADLEARVARIERLLNHKEVG